MALASGSVWMDPQGWIEIRDAAGQPVLQRGIGMVMLDAADGSGTVLRTDGDFERSVSHHTGADQDGPRDSLHMYLSGDEGEPSMLWFISKLDEDAIEVWLGVGLELGADPIQVAKHVPLRADSADGGALFLGQTPSRHRILENGSYAAIDFLVEVRPGDTPPDEAAAAIAPGDYAGHSVSNWNHAVADLDGDGAWVAGAVTFDDSLPVVNLTGRDDSGPVAADGRRGFSFFSLESDALPHPYTLEEDHSYGGEVFVVLPFEDSVQDGLEHYAELVAEHLGLTPWHRREEGRRVPNGWSSWSGSGGTGGYGTDIDEELILADAQWMADQLRDWGMTWFQVDDGYEPTYGDWNWNEERFPSGARGLSDAIRALGLTPGIWMAPFTAYEDSQLYAEHPDWFADKTALGQIVAGDYEILDLTHPEVRDWLMELATTVHEDWGFDWYKQDFSYYALFGQDLADPASSREQAWRQGLEIMRAMLGEDTFYLMVGPIGLTYDIADSCRLTLDNAPVWDWQPDLDLDDRLEQQGFKPTVHSAGRRWYLQDRVWINHPDLIIFRSNTVDESWPEVSFTEARTFATWVGLSGGIVKLGVQGPVLAYEFWTGDLLGQVEDSLVVTVPAHDNRVVALRPVTGAPQFLGWNRQLTMGGVLLEEASWDGDSETFTLRFPVVPGTELAPFTWELAVYLPSGFAYQDLHASGAAIEELEVVQEGELLRVRFQAVEVGELVLELELSGG